LARFTTFACGLGLALSALTGPRAPLAVTGLAAALVCGIIGIALGREKPSRPVSCLVVLSVIVSGLFAGYLGGSARVAALMSGDLASRTGQTVVAELVVTGPVRCSGGRQSATAVVSSLYAEDPSAGGEPAGDEGGTPGHGHWSAALPGVGETVLLEVAPGDTASASGGGDGRGSRGENAESALSQGMILHFHGSIEEPDGPTPSGYDQRRRLLHQGIEVVFRADGVDSLAVVGYRGGVSGWFDRLRRSAQAHLSRGPSGRVNEVLQGVVMGDTTGIDETWMEAFRRAGTAHMLSVSGLHVASLAGIMIGLARVAGAARWVGFLLAMMSALLMIPFVGASPPILRAAAMICVVLTGRWVGRGRDQWQILGLAAVVVLALNPFAIFDVGFQLSFAAFVGMLALLDPLQTLLRRLPAAVGSNVAVSLAASAGTAPVSLAVFATASLVSPLANLLVVPTLPLVTGLGMASVFLGFVWSGLSTMLDTLASVPMAWTIQVSRLMAVAPVLETSHVGQMVCALGGVALVTPVALAVTGRPVPTPWGISPPLLQRVSAWASRHRPRSRRWAVTAAVGIVAAGLVVGGGAYPSLAWARVALEGLRSGRGWPDQVEVRVLDVGQGNAVLVRTPEHHAILFDGGPAGCDLAGQLRGLGVRRLDLVVISHPHADHFAGLLEAVDDIEVAVFIDQVQVISSAGGPTGSPAGAARAGPSPAYGAAAAADRSAYGVTADGDSAEASEYLELRRCLAAEKCRYVLAGTGSSVQVDEVQVRLFAPARSLALVDGPDPWAERGAEPSGDELNAASLVAVVSIDQVDVLLPGDAEAEVLERYDLPRVEILLVPHHGSRGAVSDRLLDELGAEAAVVSVGEDNYFGHPHAATVALLRERIGTVLRTDTSGWVSCRVDEDTMAITAERNPAR